MKRESIGEVVFWSAVAIALALYALTGPAYLPWRSGEGSRYWRYLAAMANGNAATLAGVLAAVSAGLLGAVANRYFGWRIGMAVAIAWTFLPGVWDRVVLGDSGLALAAAVVGALWFGNAVFLIATRKARAMRETRRLALEIEEDGAAAAHDAELARANKNRKASWGILAAAVFFAVFSASMHDYRLGEAAGEYARLIVEEAGGRIIVANGLCDAQIECEASRVSCLVLRMDGKLCTDRHASCTDLVPWVRREWPGETNLWVAAQIGARAFADVAVRMHPDRFYVMSGRSSTPEQWLDRWMAMKPYLRSHDPFITAMRHAFAYEGNAIGNALQEKKAGGEGRSTEEDAALAKQAWTIYWRVFNEVEPKNPAACVNLNEMLQRGYMVDATTRQRIESAQVDFARQLRNKRRAAQAVARIAAFGAVIRDEAAYEKLRAEAVARMAELSGEGEEAKISPELRTLEEWHAEMMKAYYAKDLAKATVIARAILSRPRWRGFVPAHLVMGTAMVAEGDYVAAAAFYRVAITGKGAAAPTPFVFNEYAEVLRRLGRFDEAEAQARKAVAQSDEKEWVFRLTLAQVLRDKRRKTDDEIKAIVADALKNAPGEARKRIRKEFAP